jgi:hypothetical protein
MALNIRTLFYLLTFSIFLRDEVIEIILEHEGIFNQCSNCLDADHQIEKKCKSKKAKGKMDFYNDSNSKEKTVAVSNKGKQATINEKIRISTSKKRGTRVHKTHKGTLLNQRNTNMASEIGACSQTEP